MPSRCSATAGRAPGGPRGLGQWEQRVRGLWLRSTAGPGVLRATLKLAGKEKPELRFSSVLGAPPPAPCHRPSADNGGSTLAQERINNLFMTFNKTQTSPHWRLIKESVSQSGAPEWVGGGGYAGAGEAFYPKGLVGGVVTVGWGGPGQTGSGPHANPEHWWGKGGKRGEEKGGGVTHTPGGPGRGGGGRGTERQPDTQKQR